jgi:hypothetical protein
MDFDLTAIENFEDFCFIEIDDNISFRPTTNALIIATSFVGLNEINDSNWMEFYARIAIWESMFGSLLIDDKGDNWPISPIDVKRHIGLKTGAGNALTRTQFKNVVFERTFTDFINDAKREVLND